VVSRKVNSRKQTWPEWSRDNLKSWKKNPIIIDSLFCYQFLLKSFSTGELYSKWKMSHWNTILHQHAPSPQSHLTLDGVWWKGLKMELNYHGNNYYTIHLQWCKT
jgi:hypothetical protein